MGAFPLKKSKQAAKTVACLLFFSLAILVVVTISPVAATSSASAKSQDDASLDVLEEKLFFQKYADETAENRLARLEKRVFGQLMPGSFSERLQRLAVAAKPQIGADGTAIKDENKQEQGATVGGAAGNASSEKQDDDQQASIERARIAVAAAREEEAARLLAEGVGLWRAKRGSEALDKFEHVLRLDPKNAEAHFSMGIIYESTGNLVEALADYQEAYDGNKDNPEYAEAIKAVQAKIASGQKIDPKKAQADRLAQAAVKAYKGGEYLSALDLYKQVDEIAPKQATVKYNIGTLYLTLKDPVMAASFFKQAAELKPTESRFVQAYQKLAGNLPADQTDQTRINGKTNLAPIPLPSSPPPASGKISANPLPSKQDTSKFPGSSLASSDPLTNYGLEGLSSKDGVHITTVGIGSRAFRAGLLGGDLIKAVDGVVVTTVTQLNEILSKKAPDSPVQFFIQRKAQMAVISL